MSLVRSFLVCWLIVWLKYLSKAFFTHEMRFIGKPPRKPWANIRLVVFLNHTSLFEPVFLGGVPNSFLWRVAAHGVVPAAEKTTERPLVGLIFNFVAHEVIPITRQRDDTWFKLLDSIDPNSMVIIAPEGRMKRATGLDANGKPMSVRGGVSDILEAIGKGRMLIAYSGGLHHIQVPDHQRVQLFKKVRMNMENLDIAEYVAEMMAKGGPEEFKRSVREDLDRRRDLNCPPQE